jgi:hypothetical protein
MDIRGWPMTERGVSILNIVDSNGMIQHIEYRYHIPYITGTSEYRIGLDNVNKISLAQHINKYPYHIVHNFPLKLWQYYKILRLPKDISNAGK